MKFRSERAFTDATIEVAQRYGHTVMHMRGNTFRLIQGLAGYPDLTLAKNAEVKFWELKMPDGKLTANQLTWSYALYPRWRCYRPENWDEMVKVLSGR